MNLIRNRWNHRSTFVPSILLSSVIIIIILVQRQIPGNRILNEVREFKTFNSSMFASSPLQKNVPVKPHQMNNWRNLSNEEISRLSNLGRRLFLSDPVRIIQKRTFTIHVWKHFPKMRARYIQRFMAEDQDPFEHCSVNNCVITSDDDEILQADAVLFPLFHMLKKFGLPSDVPRRISQLWVMEADESSYNIMTQAMDSKLSHYVGIFNWSMTYMMDSDVPIPYGRTVRLIPGDAALTPNLDAFKNKTKNVAILGSNCHGTTRRYEFVRALQKYLPVDVYGKCGSFDCPGHFGEDCPLLNDYKFYLAFENTNCKDYITEKVWWQSLQKGAVPVVMGAPRDSYTKQLPPGSFIYAEDYGTPKKLAQYLRYLLENPEAFEEYHSWRNEYRVLNEHGYFQTPMLHLCRLCEALNYNQRPREDTAGRLMSFFDHKKVCYKTKWKME